MFDVFFALNVTGVSTFRLFIYCTYTVKMTIKFTLALKSNAFNANIVYTVFHQSNVNVKFEHFLNVLSH